MKIEKRRIIFAAVMGLIIMFMITYTIIIFSDDEKKQENLNDPMVPELEETGKEYNSKLDAINDLKEVRETNAPSIYDEKLIDSLGFYDPDLPEKQKESIVDSIYAAGRIQYSEKDYKNMSLAEPLVATAEKVDSVVHKAEQKVDTHEMGLEHQLFFASDPQKSGIAVSGTTDATIYAVVDGNQVVKANSRLRMRLAQTATINNRLIPKNTPIFGFISFQPNRALIDIENIQHYPTNLKVFDLQDGNEGIYVENNFRAEATNEVLDDIIGDITIPSVPQISGITKVLKRNNRNVKVTVLNNYKLILKP
jgi:hypothetical protein